ncbi:MAG: hypothetical protein A2163_00385, partial [Actinobacteria bacterium RBG_13_35_12]
KIFISLVLITVLGLITIGCTGVTPPPIIPPAACTLTVYSQCGACWGYVWVNGSSTGQWITNNGAATVTGLTAGTTVSVQIVDSWGVGSHVEYVTLSAGPNTLVFYWW